LEFNLLFSLNQNQHIFSYYFYFFLSKDMQWRWSVEKSVWFCYYHHRWPGGSG